MRTKLMLVVVMMMLGIGVWALPTFAQDDDAANAVAPAPAGESVERDSLAARFFISRYTDPAGETSVEMLGSFIIWFLLVLSALSIGFMGMMAVTNQRKSIVPSSIVEQVRQHLMSGRFREALDLTRADQSHFSQVMHAALREANHGFSAVIRSLEQTGDELTTKRLRRVEYLNVLGQVAPMIGLFGTVYGMILAFQAIVASGGDADPIQLAGGIGTALTTTFWGLVVAIPALAGYAIIRNKIDELTTEATITAEDLLNQFRSRSSQSARSGSVRTQPKPSSTSKQSKGEGADQS